MAIIMRTPAATPTSLGLPENPTTASPNNCVSATTGISRNLMGVANPANLGRSTIGTSYRGFGQCGATLAHNN
uniref:Uncharacterized protein n=1 Tax=Cannabis sativa TaxID=3483 RepID=A0A803PSB4_CANSA